MKEASWQVYLLLCADKTLYCGSTTDVERRVRQHNGCLAGGARYTKSRRPVALLACCTCPSHSSALRLEAHIKKLPKADKLPALQKAAAGTLP